jgi:GNAT superfamily N-acetyltransferase
MAKTTHNIMSTKCIKTHFTRGTLNSKNEHQKIAHNKKQYLDLLLLADESEEMIDKYLEKGDLYVLFDEDLKTVCVVIELDEQSCELKNIATCEKYQGKGYGRTMINYVIEVYKEQYKTMYLGTGEVPSILSFYNSCGFKESHRIKNFFTDNYDHIMIEEGIQLVDMVYLKKEL